MEFGVDSNRQGWYTVSTYRNSLSGRQVFNGHKTVKKKVRLMNQNLAAFH